MPSPNRGTDTNAYNPISRLVKKASRVFRTHPDPAEEEEARRRKEIEQGWDDHYKRNAEDANRHDSKNFKTYEGPRYVDDQLSDARELHIRHKPSLVHIRSRQGSPNNLSTRDGSRSRTRTPARGEGDRRPTPPPKDPGYVPYGHIQIGLEVPEHLPRRQLHSERRREG